MILPTWPEMHGAVTHFPIALLITGLAFDLGAVVFRKPEWKVVGYWLLVGAVVMALPSLVTGWMAGSQLYGRSLRLPSVFVLHRLSAFVTTALALFLLLWRTSQKDNIAGKERVAAFVLALVGVAVVSYTGFLGGRMVFGDESQTPAETARDASVGTLKSGPSPSAQGVTPQLVSLGKTLYAADANACANCHRINGKGGATGPDLSHEGMRHGDIAWQIAHLKAPDKAHPGSTMPPYDTLKADDLKAISAYMVSLK